MMWTTTTMSCPKIVVVVSHDNVVYDFGHMVLDIHQILLHRLV